jgi:nickel transport protein
MERKQAMRSILLAICLSAVMMWAAPSCRAHGVDGYVEREEGYCVTAQYDDGEPMSYAAVEIKAPDSDIVFQKGRADRNGRFMFQPDGPGRWRAVVQDGMGHRLALDAQVDEASGAPETVHAGMPANGARPGRLGNILTGLGVIFGLCGFLYGWRARSRFISAYAAHYPGESPNDNRHGKF